MKTLTVDKVVAVQRVQCFGPPCRMC